jgi:NAD(P)-dependent dehydrogenase (short-subunit alcohol dehydrogenase family)
MDYQDRHVVVTGGTGALGTAVVGTLLGAGAVGTRNKPGGAAAGLSQCRDKLNIS